ncbi:MAG: ROK family protein [Propionicimonas sp.]|nr:ROK family protein [Propionicimonas sp.]
MHTLSERVPLRDRTREEIYALICSDATLTRADLVELTGLPNSTVAHAVDRLLAEGRIARSNAEPKGPGSGSGRPGIIFKPVSTGQVIGAIDFGHGHLRVAIANDLGEPIAEVEMALDVDLHATRAMDAAAEQLSQLQRDNGVESLAVVTAGIPGPVDRHTGIVRSPTILSGWVGLDPASELRRRIGAPVRIENDAALGAYGELIQGAGRGYQDFLYVKASHGVGAGLVVNGAPYTGATGLAGEIGHTPLSDRTELCRCGRRGCLEAVVSLQAIEEQVLHTHPGMVPGAVVLDSHDPVTARLLEETGRTLGRVLADLCNLFNPAAVVLGGSLGTAGEPIVAGVIASISRYAQPATAAALVVKPAELGVRAELVGALHSASQCARRLVPDAGSSSRAPLPA